MQTADLFLANSTSVGLVDTHCRSLGCPGVAAHLAMQSEIRGFPWISVHPTE